MSGLILNQEVVDVRISFVPGSNTFIPFPCVSALELGETSVERVQTTSFSSASGLPDYAQSEVDVGEGSITYNLDLANNVHRVLLANQGSPNPFEIQLTINDGIDTYQIKRAFLNMGVSEPFNLNEILVCTLKVQATGPAERIYA